MDKKIIIGIVVVVIVMTIIIYFMMNKKTIDCVVSEWSSWNDCSKPCDGGTRTRTRTVVTKEANGGKACPSLTDTSSCNTQACPVDCSGSWLPWGDCVGTCGMGQKTRYYKVNRVASNNGKACPFNNNDPEVMECDTMKPCQRPVLIVQPQPEIVYNTTQGSITGMFNKIRIHNAWDGGFFFIYRTIAGDTDNRNTIKNIAAQLNSKKKMRITEIYSLDNKLESLTDLNNNSLPELNITSVTIPDETNKDYIYVTVNYTPVIKLREHKLISFSI